MLRSVGDLEGLAGELWRVAEIDLKQQDVNGAIPGITEAYEIVSRLDNTQGIAVIGMTLGQILATGMTFEEGLTVLRRSAEMFRKLGQEQDALRAEKIIADLGLNTPQAR